MTLAAFVSGISGRMLAGEYGSRQRPVCCGKDEPS